MANMSYCRFRNTKNDLEDCLYALEQGDTMSAEEADAGIRMFRSILRFCVDNGIIESYDRETLVALFDDLREDEDDEEED